jgi:hypothetical protein
MPQASIVQDETENSNERRGAHAKNRAKCRPLGWRFLKQARAKVNRRAAAGPRDPARGRPRACGLLAWRRARPIVIAARPARRGPTVKPEPARKIGKRGAVV